MNIIKLDATPSTNDYLKALLSRQIVENFTVVCAENQTDGRGQMGAKWNSELGKNLTFSVLVKDLLLEVSSIFHLNIVVAVSIAEALQLLKIPNLAIKWPNDILADSKKISGILIENSIKNDGEIFSIVGIGLNVNQSVFENLPKAGSLFSVTGKVFDKEMVLHLILKKLQQNLALLRAGETVVFWNNYEQYLFKKGVPMPFEDNNGTRFMGIILGVSALGKLKVQLENDTVREFAIKEVSLLF